jgi:hypothetical protein
VADQQGADAVAIAGEAGEKQTALADFAVKRLKGDLFPSLMEFMG